MIEHYKFLQLITQFIIEIPIIQRDYAQGRLLSNVTYIREKFVENLVGKMVANESFHLGFIYGKIEGRDVLKKTQMHKQAVETLLSTITQYANQFSIDLKTQISSNEVEQNSSLRFVPLDGQQRLTTLYLLFWYVNMRQKNDVAHWLCNFKYNNRKAALAFFTELSNIKTIFSISDGLEVDLKVQIKNYTWYLSKWDYDATVSGALQMLDTIHLEFNKYPDFNMNIVELENLNFSFDFLDLDELEQSDELYLKMNERGKSLTDFEHFKAWLQEYASKKYTADNQQVFLTSFWEKLDRDWLDFFWKTTDADYHHLDDLFFNYLKNLAISYHLANRNEKDIPDFLKALLQDIRNADIYDKTKVKYIPISRFVQSLKGSLDLFELFSYEVLEFIDECFRSLQLLHSDKGLSTAINDIIKRPFTNLHIQDSFLIRKAFTLTLWDHTIYFTVVKYINKFAPGINLIHFKDWLRIVRNLTYNTYIQNPENLYTALQNINKLTDDFLKPEIFLSEKILEADFELKFFSPGQLIEERRKARIIKNPEFEAEIVSLENHAYFYGQIDFILKMCSDNLGRCDMSKMRNYGGILKELFEAESEDYLLQRALLSIGDYLVPSGSNHTFCKLETDGLRSRNDNWRKVFNDSQKLKLLSELVSKISRIREITSDSTTNALFEVIRENQYNPENWEYYFVNVPFVVQQTDRLEIRWFNESNIRLLKGTAITGYHLELRTVFLLHQLQQLNLLSPFEKLEFLWDRHTEGHPGISLMNFNVQEGMYRLDVRYELSDAHKYRLTFRECTNPIKPISTRLISLLESLQFSLDVDLGQMLLFVHSDDLINGIKVINSQLQNYYDQSN